MNKKVSYAIRKFHITKSSGTQKEVIQETFMTNSHSEVQEYSDESAVDEAVDMLNANSDNNCTYKKITI